jgi:hypothetical protein
MTPTAPTLVEPTSIYVAWSDDRQHIRKWSFEPFEGAARLSTRSAVVEECERICDEQCAIIGAAPGSSIHSALMYAKAAIRKLKESDNVG